MNHKREKIALFMAIVALIVAVAVYMRHRQPAPPPPPPCKDAEYRFTHVEDEDAGIPMTPCEPRQKIHLTFEGDRYGRTLYVTCECRSKYEMTEAP